MAGFLDGLTQIILPKGRGQKGGRAFTPTFNPQNDVLAAPLYRDHLTDVYTSRVANDSRALIATLADQDPDVSAAIHAFLSVAGTSRPIVSAYNGEEELDPEGVKMVKRLLALLTTTNDYTIGYSAKPTLEALVSDMRYMILVRGMASAELVLDKAYVPNELRLIDPATIEWRQAQNGVYRPIQKPTGSNTEIDLNIPTFFTQSYHQSPLSMYTYSPFVSAINTIATRTLVINELYRIMKIVGYPRVDIKVLEDVLLANAPASIRADPIQLRTFVEGELSRIRTSITNLNSGDAFVHSSAIEASIINEKNPAAGLPVQYIIDVLDGQNQAGLKAMPAVVGKSNNGQVASTEARLFALNADSLNRTIASLLSKVLTFGLRLAGFEGRVEIHFPPVELRPELELEAQKTMRSSRLRMDLSDGIISDTEYTMAVYGRPPREGAPELSGTKFMKPDEGIGVDAQDVSPNQDSLGRSLTNEGGNGVGRDNNATAGGGGNS